MKCKECKIAMVNYRELNEDEMLELETHIQSCCDCLKLFEEVKQINQIFVHTAQSLQMHPNPSWLTNKIMASLEVKNKKSRTLLPSSFDYIFEMATLRHVMALASIILVLMFFVELRNTGREGNKMKGPVAILQTVILKSETLRQGFTERQEKKQSRLAECISPITKNLDVQCMKEKFKKTQF